MDWVVEALRHFIDLTFRFSTSSLYGANSVQSTSSFKLTDAKSGSQNFGVFIESELKQKHIDMERKEFRPTPQRTGTELEGEAGKMGVGPSADTTAVEMQSLEKKVRKQARAGRIPQSQYV